MSSNLHISVITATWQSAGTLGDCLASVAGQTWPWREHLVIDGGSTDGTVELVNGYDPSVACFVSEPDAGIYDALNKGIARARGEVIGFLHADDLYASADVLAQVAEAFADPTVDAVYGDLLYVRQEDTAKVVRYWASAPYSRRRLHWGWMPPHPTLYVRRRWYELIGGFDTRYRIAADYHSMLRLFSQPDFKAVYLPKVMVRMRVGGASNRSLRNIVVKSREDLDALQRTGVGALGGYGALVWKNVGKLGQFLRR
jgi:glycosyltransferase involved in cell wall biosynthesis